MKKVICFAVSFLISNAAFCQVPSTDIFLVNVKTSNGKCEFSEPVNITYRDGYDNQPSFTADGMKILYSSMPDTTQTDIFMFNIKDSSITELTKSDESEYSPVMLAGEKNISVIRVDTNKAQHFCTINLSDKKANVVITEGDSAAYYVWMDDSTLALCVLNNIMDLNIYELPSEQYVKVSGNVGRCLVKYPGTGDVCFIQNGMAGEKNIMRYSHQSGSVHAVGPALKGSEDFTIMPDGKFLMGTEGKLFELDTNTSTWFEIADFSKTSGNFYRLVSSPEGDRIALVSYFGKKP